MIDWRKNIEEIKVPLYVVPAQLSGWYEEGAWAAASPFTLLELGEKVGKKKSFLLEAELYAPSLSFPLSAGEKEALLSALENRIDSFLYRLNFYESLGKNYRFMFSLCLCAYIIGLFSVNTWWFIWFRQPYLALAGIDNWWKRKKAKNLEQCLHKRIVEGQDPQRKSAIDQVFALYSQLQGGGKEKLSTLITFCKEKERENPAFSEIGKIYRELLSREKEESFLLKSIAHTPIKKLARFFLGDLLLLPEILPPRLIVPVRNLSLNLDLYLQEEVHAQNSSV
ncbi:MAG: hypothetical protein ACUVQZ_01940 [Candidatus Caldatribacteriaceae bacterium]